MDNTEAKQSQQRDMNSLLSHSISSITLSKSFNAKSLEKKNSQTLTSNNGLNNVSQIVNSESIMKVFVADEENLENVNECGWTPLFRTVIGGNKNATEHLLKLGADPNTQCNVKFILLNLILI
jgi:hypothetical protein